MISGLIGFLRILKGLEAEGHWVRGSSGSFEAASDTETCQRYRHADGQWLALGSVRTGYRLATDNSGHSIAHFLLVAPNGAEGGWRMRFEV